ncbi:MAG: negative cofactor 2 transcription regulator complex subunit ncb2 [Cyphobasidiales sp. Tagirdzhanova-0007]|nr:MAG: negative cofactor 2 transcription regulator complex subunit ncb2 [Cyphobasidiales sp. Tagirdzhanova-0007]
MSDNEGAGAPGTAGTAEELNLPRATVAKLVTEFILLISSEANEICEKDSKKTILPEHIIAALKSLGYESYIDRVDEVASEHKQQSKETRARKGTNKLAQSGMTEEELLRHQEMLFAGSKARYEAAAGDP